MGAVLVFASWETRPPARLTTDDRTGEVLDDDVRPAVPVFLTPPDTTGEGERATARAALVVALIEAGLGDLPDVVPHVGQRGVSPGLADWSEQGAIPWEGAISLRWDRDDVTITLRLCDAARRCHEEERHAPAGAPWVAVGQLLTSASRWLGRAASPDRRARWFAPQSADRYGVLMLGRSAAAWYGWAHRPPEPARRWDARADPVARATYIDPSAPLGWWLQGRHALADGDLPRAVAALERAAALDPSTRALADRAAAVAMATPEEGPAAWGALGPLASTDPRFSLAVAVSGLLGESLEGRAARLDALPERFRTHPAALAQRAELARALGSADQVAILHSWAKVDDTTAAPLRQLIEHHLAHQRWGDARSYLDELERRSGTEEVAPLRLALAASAGDWTEARSVAEEMRLPRTAGALALRAELETGGTLTGASQERWDTEGLLLRARYELSRDRPESGLNLLAVVLARDPWDPEALALRVEALDVAGRRDEAEATYKLLSWVEPGGFARAELLPQRGPSPPPPEADVSEEVR
jgi:tetratricopeptide (TPR) repeat protein